MAKRFIAKELNPFGVTGLWVMVLLLSQILVSTVAAQEIFVRGIVEKSQVFVGESFLFRIQIEGDDNPAVPDISGVTDFNVEDRGGQQNSSSQVTIINGRIQEHVSRKYIYSYSLTPKRSGKLLIPSISVSVQGRKYRTDPIFIRVSKPVETKEFKLRMNFSSNEVFQGEPVVLTVIWYITKDIVDYSFTLPFLSDSRFRIEDYRLSENARRRDELVRIPIGGTEVIGSRGIGVLEGRKYTAISFKKVLIPLEPGSLRLKSSTVACNAISGYKRRSSRGPFGSLFDDDFFGDSFLSGGRKAIYNKYVVPSNEPILKVRALPLEERPSNFNGLVGSYRIISNAVPGKVNVGDPITLTIQVAGPEYLENVEIPPLDMQQSLIKDFKVPAEMAKGKIKRNVKTFTQTIRAKHSQITEIPPIELPHFDSKTGAYAVAKSEPIPIKVSPSRVVTAQDAEGRAVRDVQGQKLETWTSGIAHNYEEQSVLKNQAYDPGRWIGSMGWILLLLGPPVVYFLLLAGILFIRMRNSDPAALRARRAGGDATRALKGLGQSSEFSAAALSVLEILREYLGSKLRLSAGALTFKDVSEPLKEEGISTEILDLIKDLFAECEASRYSGGAAESPDISDLLSRALLAIEKLERKLK